MKNMFLTLNHQKLDVYNMAKGYVKECYRITKKLPADERYGMISQIRRASLSVLLNISEGASRRSEAERRRFFEIARGSMIEVDAAFEVIIDLEYLSKSDLENAGNLSVKIFQMLSRLISHKQAG